MAKMVWLQRRGKLIFGCRCKNVWDCTRKNELPVWEFLQTGNKHKHVLSSPEGIARSLALGRLLTDWGCLLPQIAIMFVFSRGLPHQIYYFLTVPALLSSLLMSFLKHDTPHKKRISHYERVHKKTTKNVCWLFWRHIDYQ